MVYLCYYLFVGSWASSLSAIGLHNDNFTRNAQVMASAKGHLGIIMNIRYDNFFSKAILTDDFFFPFSVNGPINVYFKLVISEVSKIDDQRSVSGY